MFPQNISEHKERINCQMKSPVISFRMTAEVYLCTVIDCDQFYVHSADSQISEIQKLLSDIYIQEVRYVQLYAILASFSILSTHWGQVTHVCICNRTIIGSNNGLSPGRRQAIIWTNAGIMLTGPLGRNFSEILIKILTFFLKKMCLKVLSWMKM